MLTLTQEQYAEVQRQLLEVPAKYSLVTLQYLNNILQGQNIKKTVAYDEPKKLIEERQQELRYKNDEVVRKIKEEL